MRQVIENAKQYVFQFFKNQEGSHDYYHTMRVYNMAKYIASNEKSNNDIVELSALLHDVDDYKLSPKTYENMSNAKKFLYDNNIEENVVNQICEIIQDVAFKGKDTKTPSTIEGKIVQDADRLDALGAVGIARAFTYGGNKNRVLYDKDILPNLDMSEEEYRNHVSTTINHFYEKLFKLKDLMNTKTAKKLAEERDSYMHEFIDRFKDEWEGSK